MSILPKRTTILHVEDDPALARLVRLSLVQLGFHGEILQATRVAEALDILNARSEGKAPLDLVLLDMQLPDGIGLEVLRHIKSSSVWNRTPVIFLSNETDSNVIQEAYTLGANCYLPKISKMKGGLGSIRALYECWIEGALTPATDFGNERYEALFKGVLLRTRTAKFYMGLSRVFNTTPEHESFWLERALVEGNMSNLLAFLHEQTSGQGAPPRLAKRTAEMQASVEKALNAAEVFLTQKPSSTHPEILRYVVELMEAWDEEVFIEGFFLLLPNAPTVTMALKARVLGQVKSLSNFVLQQSPRQDLLERATKLIGFAGRLENTIG